MTDRRCFWVATTLFLVLFLAGTSRGSAQASSTSARGETEREVERVLNRVEAAQVNGNLTTLDGLLADDFTYVHSTGSMETKSEFLDAIRTKRRQYHSINLEDVKVRFYGNTAVLSGITKIEMAIGTREISLNLRFLTLIVPQDGAWKMAAWQSTPIGGQSGGTRPNR